MYQRIQHPTTPEQQIIHYIQNSGRAYAMAVLRWEYDADDAVQETILQFLLHPEYLDLEVPHQKNIAKKILRNLFTKLAMQGTREQALNLHMMGGPDQVFIPEARIDFQALQMHMREREDYQINIFWLRNLGYTVPELMQRFNLTWNNVHMMAYHGKKKLLNILK